MDESFMYSMRGDPPAEFARKLEASLARQAHGDSPLAAPRRAARFAALAASVAAVAFAFSFPAVRAAARSFLDLFRVVNFAAVPVSFNQLQALHGQPLDLPRMLGDQVQVLKDPGPPVAYSTPEAAGAAVGMHVRLPTWMPVGWEVSQVMAAGEQSARVVASTEKLQQILQALHIDDVQIPDGLDGQAATMDVPPVVVVTYREDVQSPAAGAAQSAARTLTLLQARNPSVTFPAGIDLPKLGEIALRILGLDRAEAYRFARSIDWRTTLIVPVPVNAASFRQVNVQGQPGLLVERRADSRQPHGSTLLLWSSGEQVFALSGAVASPTVVEIAGSMQ